MKIKYFNKAVEWGFLVLLFLMPTIFDRRIGIVFSGTKSTTIRVIMLVLLTIWVIKLLITRKHIFVRTPLDWPVLSYILAVTAATITSVNVLISFLGFYGRYEGLISWYAFALMFFIVTNYFGSLKKLKLIIATVAPAATLMAVYGIIQRQGIDPYGWGGVVTWQRVIATIGQPNFLAAYMLMAFFLLFYFLLTGKRSDKKQVVEQPKNKYKKSKNLKVENESKEWYLKYTPALYYILVPLIFVVMIYSLTGDNVILWYLSFAAMALSTLLFAYTYEDLPRWLLELLIASSMILIYVCLFYTQSRGGYLGFLVGAVLFIILVPRKLLLRNWQKLSVLIIIIAIITVVTSLSPIYSPFQRFAGEVKIEKEEVVEQESKAKHKVELGGAAGSRGETWKSGFGIIADNPIFGIGPEVLKMVFPRYETDLFRFKETFHVKQDRCHNETFDVPVTKGMLAFFLYWGMVGFVFYLGISKLKKLDDNGRLFIAAVLAAALSYIVQNQFSFGVVAIVSLFWILWAMVTSVDLPEPAEEKGEITLADVPWLPIAAVVILSSFLIYISTIQFRADKEFKAAKTLSGMGRAKEAIGHFDKSLKILPYEGGAITHAGITNLNYSNTLKGKERQKHFKKAIDLFEFGMRVDPYNADNFYIMGRAALSKGDIGKSLEFTDTALKIDPYYAEAYITKAMIYERQGKKDLAAKHYREAYRINPNLSQPRVRIAWEALKVGKLDEAFGMFQELLIKEPRNIEVHNGLGAVYLQRGQKQRAKEEFEQVLSFDPKNAYAKKMLKWLK